MKIIMTKIEEFYWEHKIIFYERRGEKQWDMDLKS